MNTRHAAVAAAARGWHVFPCRPDDKRPAVDRWEERACADPEKVARYWPSDRHNIGGACGPSGLVVIDLDNAAHGAQLPPGWRGLAGIEDGGDVLGALARRAGQPWPASFRVTTPSGGQHLYFAGPRGREIRNSAGRIGPMIDVRAAGGYVLLPGSLIGGVEYRVADDRPTEPLPAWLADLADPPTVLSGVRGGGDVGGFDRYVDAALRRELEAVLTAGEGTRNHTLNRAAFSLGQLVAGGALEESAAADLLVQAGLQVGLGETEARRTADSGLRAGRAHPRGRAS